MNLLLPSRQCKLLWKIKSCIVQIFVLFPISDPQIYIFAEIVVRLHLHHEIKLKLISTDICVNDIVRIPFPALCFIFAEQLKEITLVLINLDSVLKVTDFN